VNRLRRHLLAGFLIAATAVIAPFSQAKAQSAPDPAVVISIADFTQHLSDVDYLAEAAGYGNMKFFAQTMVKQYIKGIDEGSPSGIMLYFNEGSEEPDFLGFVPVTNLDDLLDTISGMAEVDEGDDFTTIITDNDDELLVKEIGSNAFFSNKKEMFDNVPSDPAGLLGDMPATYNLAARIFSHRIPESLRTQALDVIREGYERSLEQLGEVEPMQAELQRKNFEFQMKQFASWINETDNLMVGMCADKEAKSLYMDFAMTALEDSELATRFNASVPTEKSLFPGFLMEGAAFNQVTSVHLSEGEIAEYTKMLEEVEKAAIEGMNEDGDLEEDEAEMAEKALKNMVELARETLAEGNLDSGLTVMLGDGDINIAGGVRLADPKKLEDTIKELVAFAEEKMGDEIQVNLNSGSHKDVTFHQIIVQIPEDEEEMLDFVGDQITLLVGIGEKAAYIGVGSNPMETLKSAMDGSGTGTSDLIQLNIFIAPILRFAANMEGQPMVEALADAMEENGEDRLRMTTDSIDNGFKMRFEMQDGILSLIKSGIEGMGANGGGFPGGDNDF
jgi:hypothetical protein